MCPLPDKGQRMRLPRLLLPFCVAVSVILLTACSANNTDIMYGAKMGFIDQMQSALKQGYSIDYQDRWGNTPLMIAVLNRQHEAVEYLCANGADVNMQNNDGATALIMAAFYNLPDEASVLLKYNPDREIKDKFGKRAIDYAEQYHYLLMISFLKAR